MAYDNTNTGLLSRNDRKESDKHPDFKGFCDIDGVEFWISGWIKESGPNSKTPGRKFFSLRFEPKEKPAQADIPFGADTSQTSQQPRGGHGQAAGMPGHGQVAAGGPGGDYTDDLPF